MKARSVVIIAICPSCVSAIGTASRSVSANSAVRCRLENAAIRVAARARSMSSMEIMRPD